MYIVQYTIIFQIACFLSIALCRYIIPAIRMEKYILFGKWMATSADGWRREKGEEGGRQERNGESKIKLNNNPYKMS